jgi:hemoglobin/transferrin/lactoferrin receptor protein
MKTVSIIVMIVFSSTLFAQDTKDTTYVHPKNFLLDEMVISASRWEQNIREVPNRISKINSSLVQFQNPQTAADLLSASNQVFIQKSQLGGGSPMIRGFATNRVLLVVDGVRMNNAIFRSGNVQNVIALDANTVEDAEIIFGPGSVIYGSDAIGGVLDFHTLNPPLADAEKPLFRVNGLSRYSSANNEITNHIDVRIGLRQWAFISSYTFSEYDDLRMGTHGPTEYLRPNYQERIDGTDVILINPNPELQVSTGYHQHNLMQKTLFKPGKTVSFQYAFHYSKSSDIPRYDRLILQPEPNTFSSAEWYYGPQQWMMHAFQSSFDKKILVWDHARITLAYQLYKESRHTRSFGGVTKTNRFEQVDAYSLNVDADKAVGKTNLYYGAEVVFNIVGSAAYGENVDTHIRSTAITRYPDGATWQTLAAYVSAKQKLSEKFLLNGSVRMSNSKTKAEFDIDVFPFEEARVSNTAFNGSIGLVYSPSINWKWYSNFSTGFRAPNVDDIGKVFDSQPGAVVVPNPTLKPEYAYSAEVGWVGVVDKFTFDFASYYTLLDNAIARARTTFNGDETIEYDGVPSQVFSQQNISVVKIGGIQVGINWKPAEKWLATSTLSWQRGSETYPDSTRTYSPTHVAPLFGSTHIVYTHAKLKVDLYADYNGAIGFSDLALTERADKHLYANDKNGNPYAPSWFTVNLKSSFKASKTISVDAGVENIFDKRYRPYASGISAPGRNAIIAVRISF